MLYDLGSQSLKIGTVTDLPNLGRKPLVERVNTGISFPRPLLEVVDQMRGDVTRTRYIQRVLEKHIAAAEQKEVVAEENQNGGMGSQVTSHVSTNTTPPTPTSTKVVARKTNNSSLVYNYCRRSCA
jgi:hypothetical protein